MCFICQHISKKWFGGILVSISVCVCVCVIRQKAFLAKLLWEILGHIMIK